MHITVGCKLQRQTKDADPMELVPANEGTQKCNKETKSRGRN